MRPSAAEHRQNILAAKPSLPQRTNRQRIMPLGQPYTLLIHHQPSMKIVHPRQTQRTLQQHLPRRGLQKVSPTHNLSNPHRRIIDNTSKLITRQPILAPNQKIPKVDTPSKRLRPHIAIDKADQLAIRNPKPIVHPRHQSPR